MSWPWGDLFISKTPTSPRLSESVTAPKRSWQSGGIQPRASWFLRCLKTQCCIQFFIPCVFRLEWVLCLVVALYFGNNGILYGHSRSPKDALKWATSSDQHVKTPQCFGLQTWWLSHQPRTCFVFLAPVLISPTASRLWTLLSWFLCFGLDWLIQSLLHQLHVSRNKNENIRAVGTNFSRVSPRCVFITQYVTCVSSHRWRQADAWGAFLYS